MSMYPEFQMLICWNCCPYLLISCLWRAEADKNESVFPMNIRILVCWWNYLNCPKLLSYASRECEHFHASLNDPGLQELTVRLKACSKYTLKFSKYEKFQLSEKITNISLLGTASLSVRTQVRLKFIAWLVLECNNREVRQRQALWVVIKHLKWKFHALDST